MTQLTFVSLGGSSCGYAALLGSVRRGIAMELSITPRKSECWFRWPLHSGAEYQAAGGLVALRLPPCAAMRRRDTVLDRSIIRAGAGARASRSIDFRAMAT